MRNFARSSPIRSPLRAEALVLERQISCSDMGVQTVPATALFLKGTEQSALRHAEGSGFEIAAEYGSIHVAIFARLPHLDCKITGMDFNVLAPRQLLDRCFSERHAEMKIHYFGHLHHNAEVVSRAAANLQFSPGPRGL